MKNGGVYSDIEHTEVGVPQGHVLSATLFNIAINTILKDISTGVKGSLYVDDLMIYLLSKRTQILARTLKRIIKKLEEWADKNNFKFSPPRFEVIHFWRNIPGGKDREYYPQKLYWKEIPIRETT